MRNLWLPSLVLAILFTITACAQSGGVPGSQSSAPSSPGPASPGVATSADLYGRTFVSTGADGYSLAPGSMVRLALDLDRLGASAGCNRMSGEYEIVDGVLQVGMLAMTEMACQEPLMSQDTWLASFLPGASISLAEDTLTLAKDGVTLTFLDDEVANPDRPLEGTRWVVDGIVAKDAVSSVPSGATASLRFDGGTVTVEAGCNTGSGSYTLGEGRITFSPIGMTEKACAADVMALEDAVLRVLAGEAAYAIDGSSLMLRNGASGLTLTAAP